MKANILALLVIWFIVSPSFGANKANIQVSAGFPAVANIVDDFNNASPINIWGGTNLGFILNSGDSFALNYDSTQKVGATGYSAAMAFNLGVSTNFCGLAMFMTSNGSKNISGYNSLIFNVKGSVANLPFKIEMENASGDTSRKKAILYLDSYLPGSITTGWQQVTIPLNAFCNLDSKVNATKLTFTVEKTYADHETKPSIGTIYIDNVMFSNTNIGYVNIESAGDKYGLNDLGANNGSMGAHTESYVNTYFVSPPYSLKSDYVVPTGWCGMFIIFGGGGNGNIAESHDFSAYTKLTMQVRTGSAGTTPAKFKVELSDGANFSVLIPDNASPSTAISPSSWTKYTVLLTSFAGLNKAAIKQMNIIYDSVVGANTTGTVYFDDIRFE